MTLTQARKMRDEIIEKLGCHCTVPLGHGPDGYFARIWTSIGPASPRDFHSHDDLMDYLVERYAHFDEIEAKAKARIGRPKSPLEMMIDRACGITEYGE